MTIVKMAMVYNSILEESNLKVIFIRNGREFYGPLFWEKDEWEEVLEVCEEIKVEDSDERNEVLQSIQKYLELEPKYQIPVHDSSKNTMLHWQYINGFSEIIFLEAYQTAVSENL